MEKKSTEKSDYDPKILPDLLPLYYKRLFPHKAFYRWLSYGEVNLREFANREFSFTFDDIFCRYLSFESQSELENAINTKVPHKIDIGAVFNSRPKNHRTVTKMEPYQRELVFDIDLTDYDPVRTCCQKADICPKCWKFMVVACRILDIVLRDDFGFEHILWVYSGRRGIHCWVCDEKARWLTKRQRSAVAEYIQIEMTGNKRFMIVERMHHSIRRAYKIIEQMFDEVILEDQNLFATTSGLNVLLQLIFDESIRNDLDSKLKSLDKNSKLIWNTFVQYIGSLRAQGKLSRKMNNIVEEAQLILMYPRLDINVSMGLNHLLKSPFCIHPGTGRVCVPFNANAVSKFDPLSVPTITQLLHEVNEFDEKNAKTGDVGNDEKQNIKDFKKTAMSKGIFVFEEFLRKLEHSFSSKSASTVNSKFVF